MTRLRTPLLSFATALVLALPVCAQDHDPHGLGSHDLGPHDLGPGAEDWAPEFQTLGHHDRGILPLHRAAQIVSERFRGRLIAARLVPPSPAERARGVALVHELRLLTPARDVLLIRLDAQSGDFLEVAGAGLTKARRKGPEK